MSPARRALLAVGLSLLSALFFTTTYVLNRAAASMAGTGHGPRRCVTCSCCRCCCR